MKKRLWILLPYILVLAVDFYLLPLLVRDTGTAMLFMLLVMPFTAFACALICSARHGFVWPLPVITAVLFAPSLFLYYNASAWVYIPTYAVVVLVGNMIGKAFHQKR